MPVYCLFHMIYAILMIFKSNDYVIINVLPPQHPEYNILSHMTRIRNNGEARE